MLLKKYLKLISLSVSLTAPSGCATIDQGSVISDDIVKIETHRSRLADIRNVIIYKQNDGYLIKGNVTRSIQGRSNIQGHLDLELLNAQGKVVYNISTRYKHSGLRFNKEKFSLLIKKEINKGSLLRITHIESEMHKEK